MDSRRSPVTALAMLALLTASTCQAKSDPPPRQIRAELSRISIEHNVRFGDYVDRPGPPDGDYTRAEGRKVGNVVDFQVRILGLKGRKNTVTWAVYTSGSSPRRLYDDTPWELIPEADDDRASLDVWVPLPASPGRYFVRLEVRDFRNNRLTYADSRTFSVH